MEKLNQTSIDIEFLLISVVQGLALAALAQAAVPIIENLQFEYFGYVISGFLFILIFWSGAIVHAVSFIDWPLDLFHNFLYFLAAFFEVIAFSQMTNPSKWFGFILVFFCVVAVLYIVDLHLIKNHKSIMEKSEAGKKLYTHILSAELFEMRILLPLGSIFTIMAFIFIMIVPSIFIVHQWHIVLICLQICFNIFFLIHSIHTFKKRAFLLSQVQKR